MPLLLAAVPPAAVGLGLALASAVLAAGCLYLDAPNHRPVARLAAPPLQPVKGSLVELDASASTDPDAGETPSLAYAWRIDGHDLTALPRDVAVTGGRPSPSRLAVLLYGVGQHQVEVVAIDLHGARSLPAVATVTVHDAPPQAGPIAVNADAALTPCHDYPAGVALDLLVRASDADARQDPAHARFAESLRYRFTLSRKPDGSTMPSLTAGACASTPPAPGALVWVDVKSPPQPTDPGGGSSGDSPGDPIDPRDQDSDACLRPDVAGVYTVEVFAEDCTATAPDGQPTPLLCAGDRRSTQHRFVDLAVGPDRPPCLDGTSPPPGSYLLPRSTPATFRVTEVLDDLDRFPSVASPSNQPHPRFTWSIFRAGDPTWRALADHDLPSLTVDPTTLPVDELVRVRVAVTDRVPRPLPSCDVGEALCPLVRDHPPEQICQPDSARCEQWVTWDVRFR